MKVGKGSAKRRGFNHGPGGVRERKEGWDESGIKVDRVLSSMKTRRLQTKRFLKWSGNELRPDKRREDASDESTLNEK